MIVISVLHEGQQDLPVTKRKSLIEGLCEVKSQALK